MSLWLQTFLRFKFYYCEKKTFGTCAWNAIQFNSRERIEDFKGIVQCLMRNSECEVHRQMDKNVQQWITWKDSYHIWENLQRRRHQPWCRSPHKDCRAWRTLVRASECRTMQICTISSLPWTDSADPLPTNSGPSCAIHLCDKVYKEINTLFKL